MRLDKNLTNRICRIAIQAESAVIILIKGRAVKPAQAVIRLFQKQPVG